MTGRITSFPSRSQSLRTLLHGLQCKAWRIVDRVALAASGEKKELPLRWRPDAVAGVLHIGFVSILETAEQIERLRNEPLDSDFLPARSRIIKTLAAHFLAPIDATAARVAGGDDGRQHSDH